MEKDIEKVLLTEEEIMDKIRELGRILSKEYAGKNPLVICVLRGGAPFMTDLVRRMDIPLEMDFMAVSSYGASTESSGVVRIMKDLDTSVEERHVLIVEDIIDSGLTLSYLIDNIQRRNAASVKVVTLLDKPARRTVDLTPDYCGFQIPDAFVVGYGLDYAEKYRNLPYIGILKSEVYS
ncbi:hypoxanthine phosphoribosyltransferase [Aneurinibacillus aneurinilyticus]|jgi:hypoxanthine phosphoribosyltransferase|uniref:Hypoxanthine phosphoribosyltransferase n=2 Tax=Aneurinibacillus aneurinilyticus TaxID=1391 RepID=A0A848D2D9_ANEAE|nr:hypoxanthine phosphoribosyltransferase [Aneurinibacillus aneurinilyticus]ERI08752.1 hypoxanthine phosphoribosyltransferase [Aneurinibacillus aneurinilyticus ATCC 12856]MCI1695320.1 hypoxanthine phosphoribosyltransferase [Aneurinibacillus aneurinilyticus]MED0671578.1 hypoxanthine phosphoribosyltransferase [Aneurinibacillus aneurinilyticus]MED0706870.1 hypoxanthine phosphoribosyltransferase [Aneurinibacillus aneurinilyticus]MED0723373.1 hypoxanthine phosphoribosyltransferase [Aneurinibacillus